MQIILALFKLQQKFTQICIKDKNKWEYSNADLFVFGQSIQQHVVSKNVQFVTSTAHFVEDIEGLVGFVGAEVGLEQTLVCVRVHGEVPLLDQGHAEVEVLGVAEEADEDVDGGDVATRVGLVHLGEEGADEIEAVWGGGLGEDEDEAGVGEGVVLEIRGKRGAEAEEVEGEGGVV